MVLSIAEAYMPRIIRLQVRNWLDECIFSYRVASLRLMVETEHNKRSVELTVKPSLGMLPDLQASLLGGPLRVEEVPDHFVVDLQH